MPNLKPFFVLILCLTILPSNVAIGADEDEEENPQLSLKTILPYAMTLLEEKKHVQFLKELAPPKLKIRLLQDKSIEELAAQFGRKKAGELLVVFTNIEKNGIEPEMSQDGSKASYEFQLEGETNKRKIFFLKINKKWYISNKKS